jgi:hypothetical protein
VAVLPLWQLEQPVATVTLAWNLAGAHAVKLLWHVPQVAVVEMCVAVLPVALLPLWQLAQLVVLLNVL